MNRITDVKETVNQAIKYAVSNPCCICVYEHLRTHECIAGVKYKGTCPVFLILKGELLKMKEVEE